jgi:hypothetical protein
MKLGLKNYTVNIPAANTFFKFNNSKINILHIYDISQNCRILD